MYNNGNYCYYNLELFGGNVTFFWKGSCVYSETVVYMKEIECISKCVLGSSFGFCSLVTGVVSLWGEKVDLPKIGRL